MTLFDELEIRAAELDKLAQAYLDSLPFVSNEECKERIWIKAKEIFHSQNMEWKDLPEWVASVIDGHIPYSVIPRNGSLHFVFGFSVLSMEAHLRNLLEIAEGRTTVELDFPIVAEMSKI